MTHNRRQNAAVAINNRTNTAQSRAMPASSTQSQRPSVLLSSQINTSRRPSLPVQASETRILPPQARTSPSRFLPPQAISSLPQILAPQGARVSPPQNLSSGTSRRASAVSMVETLSLTNIYIWGLNDGTTDADIIRMCSKYGNIVSTKAIIDPQTSKCKGYGFVEYDCAETAEAALERLQADGLNVQMARQQEQDQTNLYICGLPELTTDTDLAALFAPFGSVDTTHVLLDPNGVSRRVGFVRMQTTQQCEAIILAYNGAYLPGHPTPLSIKFADAYNKRKYQSQRRQSNVEQPKISEVTQSFKGLSLAHQTIQPVVSSVMASVPQMITVPSSYPIQMSFDENIPKNWVALYEMPKGIAQTPGTTYTSKPVSASEKYAMTPACQSQYIMNPSQYVMNPPPSGPYVQQAYPSMQAVVIGGMIHYLPLIPHRHQ